ncbi:hypothetical protein GCM10020295_03200 [Streptomyces cinereospinus]
MPSRERPAPGAGECVVVLLGTALHCLPKGELPTSGQRWFRSTSEYWVVNVAVDHMSLAVELDSADPGLRFHGTVDVDWRIEPTYPVLAGPPPVAVAAPVPASRTNRERAAIGPLAAPAPRLFRAMSLPPPTSPGPQRSHRLRRTQQPTAPCAGPGRMTASLRPPY